MKLLTTIAAVLISICAYSQDYVEYNEGTFSQNGEEISTEQLIQLTIRYKVGRRILRDAISYEALAQPEQRLARNTQAAGMVVAGIASAPTLVVIGALASWDSPLVGGTLIACGLASIPVSIYTAYVVTSTDKLRVKADKKYIMLAEKINQAIAAGGQSSQPSNTYIHESFK